VVDHQVRAMTWNIWWRFGPRWRERQPGILATIERFTPDVVALQEVWSADGTTQAEHLAKQLGFHSTFAAPSYPTAPDPPVFPDHEGVELGVALLSRWPILSQDVIAMPSRDHAALDTSFCSARGRPGVGRPADRPHLLPARTRGPARQCRVGHDRRGRCGRRLPVRPQGGDLRLPLA
jgi:hypothetical protein